MRHIILYPDETGQWHAECPSLPGCNSEGSTREEALSRIKAAAQFYLEVLKSDGRPAPEDRVEVVKLKL